MAASASAGWRVTERVGWTGSVRSLAFRCEVGERGSTAKLRSTAHFTRIPHDARCTTHDAPRTCDRARHAAPAKAKAKRENKPTPRPRLCGSLASRACSVQQKRSSSAARFRLLGVRLAGCPLARCTLYSNQTPYSSPGGHAPATALCLPTVQQGPLRGCWRGEEQHAKSPIADRPAVGAVKPWECRGPGTGLPLRGPLCPPGGAKIHPTQQMN